ncbi:Hypothetical_protein [Hexamita inflata]|uniref:Hypothetical_protein n=1 Tax=Hexamita inflata TaxID=28002 RepID=A0ABP1IAK7_9EUKA
MNNVPLIVQYSILVLQIIIELLFNSIYFLKLGICKIKQTKKDQEPKLMKQCIKGKCLEIKLVNKVKLVRQRLSEGPAGSLQGNPLLILIKTNANEKSYKLIFVKLLVNYYRSTFLIVNTRTNISELTKYTTSKCTKQLWSQLQLNCVKVKSKLQYYNIYIAGNWILAQFLLYKDILVYINNSIPSSYIMGKREQIILLN